MKKLGGTLLAVLLATTMAGARQVSVTTTNIYTAMATAQPGDTLQLAAGNYSFGAPSRDGTLAAPIVMRGASVSTVVNNSGGEGLIWGAKHWVLENIHLKGDGGNYHMFHLKPGAKGYLTIRNCKISGIGADANSIPMAFKLDFSAYEGPINVWPDYILVENTEFVMGWAGFWNNDAGDFCTLRGNYLHGFVQPEGTLQYVFFNKGGLAYDVFENNLVVGGGMVFSFGGGRMGQAAAMTSYRHDLDLGADLVGQGMSNVGGYELFSVEAWRNIARNNIVFGALSSACHSQTSVDCEVYNNTFIGCPTSLVREAQSGPIKNLRFYNNLSVNGGDDFFMAYDGYTDITGTDTVCIQENCVALGELALTSVFQNFKANDTLGSDFRLKQSIYASVGAGRTPYAHADWPAFGNPLKNGNYDFYGTIRPNPPTIGATEPYGGVAVEMDMPQAPDAAVLLTVAPNPANPSTNLILALKRNQPLVDAMIYDIRGRHVRSLYYGPMDKGVRSLRWDGRDHNGQLQASGVYFFRVSLGREVLGKKFELAR